MPNSCTPLLTVSSKGRFPSSQKNSCLILRWDCEQVKSLGLIGAERTNVKAAVFAKTGCEFRLGPRSDHASGSSRRSVFVGLLKSFYSLAFLASPQTLAGGDKFFSPQTLAGGDKFFSPQTLAGGDKFFAEMETLAAKHSIAEIIQKLPADMRKNVVVMLESASLQPGGKVSKPNLDCTRPRFILFSEDGTRVVTFNSDPSQEGFETLEIRFFDSKTSEFFFKEVVSKKDLQRRQAHLQKTMAKDPTRLALEIQRLKQRTNRVGVNPPVCMACHDRNNPNKQKPDPSDRFEQYSRWPGALGEHDDTIRYYFDPTVEAGICLKQIREKWERKDNDRFLQLSAVDEILSPKFEERRLNTNNAKFTFTIYPLVYQRARRLIEARPDGAELKFKLLKVWMCDKKTLLDPASSDAKNLHMPELLKVLGEHGVTPEQLFPFARASDHPGINDGFTTESLIFHFFSNDRRYQPYFSMSAGKKLYSERTIARSTMIPSYSFKFNKNRNLCSLKSAPPLPRVSSPDPTLGVF